MKPKLKTCKACHFGTSLFCLFLCIRSCPFSRCAVDHHKYSSNACIFHWLRRRKAIVWWKHTDTECVVLIVFPMLGDGFVKRVIRVWRAHQSLYTARHYRTSVAGIHYVLSEVAEYSDVLSTGAITRRMSKPEKHRADLQCRAPLVFEDVQADAPKLVHIWVVNLSQEADFRRLKRVARRQEKL